MLRDHLVLTFRACNAKNYIDQKQVADSLLFKYFKPGQVVRYISGTVALPTRCSSGYVGNTFRQEPRPSKSTWGGMLWRDWIPERQLLMIYWIIHNLVDIEPEPPLMNARSNKGHNHCLSQIRARTAIFQNSFFPATVVFWNKLPQVIVDQTSLDAFKTALVSQHLAY